MSLLIPLFPLKLVVFPNSRYPLHIFETKYKLMVRDCLEKNTGFGIVAMLGKEISTVGSYVRISSVIKEYENGESDIIVQGLKRFSINKIDVHENGYFIADVYDFEDTENETDAALLEEIKSRFESVLQKIDLQLEESFWKNFITSGTKSFKIAEKSGLSIEEQQELLSIRNENARLIFLRDHFEKLDEQLSKKMINKVIIMNDGYIN